MRRRAHLLVVLAVLLLGISGCSTEPAPALQAEVAPTTDEKFRAPTDLECDGASSSGLVVDYEMGAVGKPSPALAARSRLAADGVDPAGLTEQVLTDATGSTFVDYRSADDRLVLYVELSPAAEDTWLASYVYACAEATPGG